MVVKYIKIDSKLNLKPSIACIGFFDGVHIGHQKLILETIKQAKKYNTFSSIICFTPDPDDVISSKKNKHLTNISERLSIFDNLGIDFVYIFRFNQEFMKMSPNIFINKYLNNMNIIELLCGSDFRYGYKGKGDVSLLKDKGNFKLKVVSDYKFQNKKVSSTRIRQALDNGNLKLVNRLLGYNYFIKTKVFRCSKDKNKWLIELKPLNKDKYLPINGIYCDFLEIKNNHIFMVGPNKLKIGQAILLEFSNNE